MPRKKFRTAQKKTTNCSIVPNTQPSRKRKCWTEEQIKRTLEEFKKGKPMIGKIAQKYKVPKTTLHDRISGQVKHGTKPGPQPYLQANEEEVLVDHSIKVPKVGYGKARKQVNMIVETVAKEKGLL